MFVAVDVSCLFRCLVLCAIASVKLQLSVMLDPACQDLFFSVPSHGFVIFVSINAVDCMKNSNSEMTYCVTSRTLIPPHSYHVCSAFP